MGTQNRVQIGGLNGMLNGMRKTVKTRTTGMLGDHRADISLTMDPVERVMTVNSAMKRMTVTPRIKVPRRGTKMAPLGQEAKAQKNIQAHRTGLCQRVARRMSLMGGMILEGKEAPTSGTRMSQERTMIGGALAGNGMDWKRTTQIRRQKEITKHRERETVRVAHVLVTVGAESVGITYAGHAVGQGADSHMKPTTTPRITIGIKTIGSLEILYPKRHLNKNGTRRMKLRTKRQEVMNGTRHR